MYRIAPFPMTIHLLQALAHTILPRDAMLARYMLSLCVRLSVHPSITSQYCTKTAKHRIIMQAKMGHV